MKPAFVCKQTTELPAPCEIQRAHLPVSTVTFPPCVHFIYSIFISFLIHNVGRLLITGTKPSHGLSASRGPFFEQCPHYKRSGCVKNLLARSAKNTFVIYGLYQSPTYTRPTSSASCCYGRMPRLYTSLCQG